MMYIGVIVVVVLLVEFCLPGVSHAWGPGIHMYTGTAVLKYARDFIPAVAPLLEANPLHFLYGCLSADIFFGKKGKSNKKRCHTWEIGTKLLETSKNDPEKAYAYGFISHLAADTVAHNLCLPHYMTFSSKNNKLQHCFWEWQFDQMVAKGYRVLAKKVFSQSYPTADRVLCSLTKVPLAVFWTKKAIYSRTLKVYGRKTQSSHSVLFYVYLTYHQEKLKHLGQFLSLSVANIIEVLQDPSSAACMSMDPLGEFS